MTYQITITIDPQRVQDMIIGAFEGGSTYWIAEANLIHPKFSDLPEDGVVWWGNSKRNVFDEPDFKVEVVDDEGGKHILDASAVTRGLSVMAVQYGQHFSDMTTENDDAITADVFLQCCLFGEIQYG